ncbi:MAG TPA: helix-turn-helix domain-containing protein [Planctomycetaceae bacterium]|nr:helix-turn-helix domain-containing protein [Planctomycetaceae bacterium]
MAGKPQLWTKWFFSHWLADAGVRSVSLEARGLWIDMLALMDQAPRRGYLQHANGRPLTAEQLAVSVGSSVVTVSRLLQELENAGVYSSDATQTIYSRRMTRETNARAREAESRNVRRSSGHCPSNVRDEGLGGAFSFSLHTLYPDLIPRLPFQSEGFRQAVQDWLAYKREKRQAYTATGLPTLLRKLEKLGERRAIDAIEHSIASNYTGLYEPDGRHRQTDQLRNSLDEAERRLRGI